MYVYTHMPMIHTYKSVIKFTHTNINTYTHTHIHKNINIDAGTSARALVQLSTKP